MGKKKQTALKESSDDMLSDSGSSNKRKMAIIDETEDLSSREEVKEQKTKNKKKKKELLHSSEESSADKDSRESNDKSTLVNKNRMIDETENCRTENVAELNKKINKRETQYANLNKKIKFDDNGSELSSSTNTNSNLKFLNQEEAEVKEEDIDNFCAEINEEDNALYENWVKLLEEQFHSKSKKKSNSTNNT